MGVNIITNEELVYKLTDAFDSIELTPTDVDEALWEVGYDPDEIGAKMKAIADETLARGICCEILKERTDKPVWGERIVAFDKTIPGGDITMITKLREGKVIRLRKLKTLLKIKERK